MLQVRGDLNLGQEPLGAEHDSEFRLQELEGDLSVVAGIARKETRGHAAGTDLAIELIATGERIVGLSDWVHWAGLTTQQAAGVGRRGEEVILRRFPRRNTRRLAL